MVLASKFDSVDTIAREEVLGECPAVTIDCLRRAHKDNLYFG